MAKNRLTWSLKIHITVWTQELELWIGSYIDKQFKINLIFDKNQLNQCNVICMFTVFILLMTVCVCQCGEGPAGGGCWSKPGRRLQQRVRDGSREGRSLIRGWDSHVIIIIFIVIHKETSMHTCKQQECVLLQRSILTHSFCAVCISAHDLFSGVLFVSVFHLTHTHTHVQHSRVSYLAAVCILLTFVLLAVFWSWRSIFPWSTMMNECVRVCVWNMRIFHEAVCVCVCDGSLGSGRLTVYWVLLWLSGS